MVLCPRALRSGDVPSEAALVKESLAIVGICLKRILGPWPLPPTLFLTHLYEISSFAPLWVFYGDICPHNRHESNGANQPWTETSKIMEKNESILLNGLSWVFCHGYRKLTNGPGIFKRHDCGCYSRTTESENTRMGPNAYLFWLMEQSSFNF